MEPFKIAKPQCGSVAGEDDVYSVPLHVAGLFLVLLVSTLGAAFPVAAKKITWLRIPPKVFFACKHFGTGVLIATAFVHLLPTAFGNLLNPCLPDFFIEKYRPLAGVIMMAAMFALFVIELYLHAKVGGHSHGGNTGAGIVPPPRPAHNRNISEGFESSSDDEVGREKEFVFTTTRAADVESNSAVRNGFGHGATPVTESEADYHLYKKMAANISMLEGGILFHSVFVGISVSLTTGNGYIVLLIAILFHQAFEGLGLGSRIAEVPWGHRTVRPWILVVAFGTTAPIGQAIGLISRSSFDPEGVFGLVIVGVFNAISSGLLVYAALVDLLVEDFLGHEGMQMKKSSKIWAFSWVILGAAGMSIVGAFA